VEGRTWSRAGDAVAAVRRLREVLLGGSGGLVEGDRGTALRGRSAVVDGTCICVERGG